MTALPNPARMLAYRTAAAIMQEQVDRLVKVETSLKVDRVNEEAQLCDALNSLQAGLLQLQSLGRAEP